MKITSSYGVELRKQNIPIRQTLDVYQVCCQLSDRYLRAGMGRTGRDFGSEETF